MHIQVRNNIMIWKYICRFVDFLILTLKCQVFYFTSLENSKVWRVDLLSCDQQLNPSRFIQDFYVQHIVIDDLFICPLSIILDIFRLLAIPYFWDLLLLIRHKNLSWEISSRIGFLFVFISTWFNPIIRAKTLLNDVYKTMCEYTLLSWISKSF